MGNFRSVAERHKSEHENTTTTTQHTNKLRAPNGNESASRKANERDSYNINKHGRPDDDDDDLRWQQTNGHH